MRLISLPAIGRRVSVPAYVEAIRRAKARPAHEFSHSLECWWPQPGSSVVAEFRKRIHQHISAQMPGYGQGRKWGEIWQVETMRAARALNEPRLAIHWLPSWLKPRFQHRLAEAF